MPIVNGVYVSPNWVNNSTPPLDATEMQAITSTLQKVPIANGGTGATTAAGARAALGLGNTDGALPVANGGTGATTAAGARAALGLGTTDGALPVANGGTGATTAAGARTALGITPDNIGAVPASGGTVGGDLTVNGNLTAKFATPVPVAQGGTGAATVAGARAALGLGNTDGAVPIANGGTGKTTAADAIAALGGMPKSGGSFTGSVTFGQSATFSNLMILSGNSYGSSLPTTYLTTGRLFFKKV